VVSLAEQIELRLPTARTVNPTTGSNWEGVGVQPDVVTEAYDALAAAYRRALEAIATNASRTQASRDEAAQALVSANNSASRHEPSQSAT
jgi:hypothetical protein